MPSLWLVRVIIADVELELGEIQSPLSISALRGIILDLSLLSSLPVEQRFRDSLLVDVKDAM